MVPHLRKSILIYSGNIYIFSVNNLFKQEFMEPLKALIGDHVEWYAALKFVSLNVMNASGAIRSALP